MKQYPRCDQLHAIGQLSGGAQQYFKTATRGLTLVEIILVLTIMGLIIGGIWAAVAGAVSGHKQKRLNDQVMATVENVRDYYRKKATLETASTTFNGTGFNTTGISLGLFPADMVKTGTGGASTLRHAYGGSVITGIIVKTGRISNYFGIQLNALPKEACINLLYSGLGNGVGDADDVHWTAGTNGNMSTGNWDVAATANFPVSLDDANIACRAAPINIFLAFGLS